MIHAPERTVRIVPTAPAAPAAPAAPDHARELFRQSGTMPTRSGHSVMTAATRPVARSASGTWALPRSPHPSRVRAVLVCMVCLCLGVGVGHAVREGSAYASSVSRAEAPVREAREGVSLTAAAGPSARGKDVAMLLGAAPSAKSARAKTKPRAAASPSSHAPDAMFVDFEPSFRPAS